MKKGKAGTMAGLAAMYDSGPCMECHRAIYDEWRGSAHAKSVFGNGKTADSIRMAVQDGLMRWPYSGVKSGKDVKVEHLMECAKCHLPQLADADDEVARELVGVLTDWKSALDNDKAAAEQAAGKLSAMNIGCLICHNRNAIIHKWADGYPKAGEIYGSREGTHPGKDFSVLRKDPIMGESILCGQCHGLGPNLEMDNPTQCSSIYGSYLYAYRAHGGRETCQDCHMRKSKLGHGTRASSEPGMVKAAIEVSADARGFQWRDGDLYVPRIVVEVGMTNKAGHSIPGSISTDKRLVLEVTAKGSDGTELFSKSMTYMPIPQRLGRGGRTGRGPHDKSGIVDDTALPPNRTVRERFDIVLEPPEAGKPNVPRPPVEVTVNVTLRHIDSGRTAGESGKWFEFTRLVKIEAGP